MQTFSHARNIMSPSPQAARPRQKRLLSLSTIASITALLIITWRQLLFERTRFLSLTVSPAHASGRPHPLNSNSAITPSNPFVSFIIPTKMRDTLNRTVLSLKNQTRDNWEAIVGIDVQNIHTDHLLERFFDDQRFSYMLVGSVGQNRGPALNGAGEIRNKMILDGARGDWVAFVDDDDTISPHYVEWLQNSVMQHEQQHNTTVDLVLFRMKFAEARKFDNRTIFPPWEHKNRAHNSHVGISYAVRRHLFTSQRLAFASHNAEDYNLLKAAFQQHQQQSNSIHMKIADCVAYFVRANPPLQQPQQPTFCNLTDLFVA